MSDEGEEAVTRHRRAARWLQSTLRGADVAAARAAALRCTQSPAFASASIDDLCSGRVVVARRAAMDVIALEAGFAGWAHLLTDLLPEFARVTMHVPAMGAWVNRWFVSWSEAAASLAAESGVLLPYRSQFFVTALEAVRELGLAANDPDWARIGFDWVQPRDPEARLRLARQRWQVMLAQGEDLP